MFERISHRGTFCQGDYARGTVCIAQNHLRADCPDVAPADAADVAPIASPDRTDLRIAYDGQIGNGPELAQPAGVADGPFREERAILGLYRKHGPGVLDHLDDAVFSLVIVDGDELFAARDFLGVKTLFYGRGEDGALYLASELKSVAGIVEEVHAFPPGCWMDSTGALKRFADLPEKPPAPTDDTPETMARTVREMLDRSPRRRVDFARPTACLLSGGMDSSAITALAAQLHRERFACQMEAIRFVHNTAALRLDRTNQRNSVRVVVPFVSGELYEYTMRIPMDYKVRDVDGRTVEKYMLRNAFENDLPREIIERTKQEFSQGSGVAKLMPEHFETVFSDAELAEARAKHPVVRTKEEYEYFRLFAEHYGTGSAVATVGQWKHF
ncbi:MAG: asparagine synthase-related protein [Planctomycetota bacterium]|nr:asparagine synthase-related protein [Planctomycetota bacterium]